MSCGTAKKALSTGRGDLSRLGLGQALLGVELYHLGHLALGEVSQLCDAARGTKVGRVRWGLGARGGGGVGGGTGLIGRVRKARGARGEARRKQRNTRQVGGQCVHVCTKRFWTRLLGGAGGTGRNVVGW